ncbi:hypothetical protein FisN_14Hh029 [Fistulifera solaris]|uniref:Uncharacterized protein n=1 Tax=Fistulifera solaris TaxID=1519565 RepID=A0A1Z5K875_FISSO|nr:hypothetical protein FisN_14Hh029 [Fistulifera solaris]|eukprot:GAX22416.1 hypothetical protein FisN_14Hh029 [Fistulifera solaris]
MIEHLLIVEFEQFHAIILFLLVMLALLGNLLLSSTIYTDRAIILCSIMCIQILLGFLWKNRDMKRSMRYWVFQFLLMILGCCGNIVSAIYRISAPEEAKEQGSLGIFMIVGIFLFFAGNLIPLLCQKPMQTAMYQDIRERTELAKQEWSRKEEEYTETSNEVLLESE